MKKDRSHLCPSSNRAWASRCSYGFVLLLLFALAGLGSAMTERVRGAAAGDKKPRQDSSQTSNGKDRTEAAPRAAESPSSQKKDLGSDAARGGCGPLCDYCWLGTVYQNNCPRHWAEDQSCDCWCQFSDSCDCEGTGCTPCATLPRPCDYCNLGTSDENDCPYLWVEDGDCDCGCQFSDSCDCDGTGCGDPCAGLQTACDDCWLGTSYENNCPQHWVEDGYCDCGCQFSDSCDCDGTGCTPCAALPRPCDYCWLGTSNENDCPYLWVEDGYCDCGCQFSDPCDCEGTGCGVPCAGFPHHCDYCWVGTSNENDCPTSWVEDGGCDCGCQFSDSCDCEGTGCTPCAALPRPCDYCWLGTSHENNCPRHWQEDQSCDCGCQFSDSCDCEGTGCTPCAILPRPCDYCWLGTGYENNCLLNWVEDGGCDCGCQFSDSCDCEGVQCGMSACTGIVSSSPPDCEIDGRQPHPVAGPVTPKQGYDRLILTMSPANCDASQLTTAKFSLQVAPGPQGPLTISSVMGAGNIATVIFNGVIPTKNWTCVRGAMGVTGKACIGFLPADVNKSRASNAQDITALVNALNNAVPRPLTATDANRSGAANAQDIPALINLLNGAGQFSVSEPGGWLNKTIPVVCPP